MERITRVDVAKRSNQYPYFKEVELRVGNVDESDKGAVQLTANPKVGHFGAATGERVAVFDLTQSPASGKFLTLQQVQGALNVNELFIRV